MRLGESDRPGRTARIVERRPTVLADQTLWRKGEPFIPDSLTSTLGDIPQPVYVEGIGEGFHYNTHHIARGLPRGFGIDVIPTAKGGPMLFFLEGSSAEDPEIIGTFLVESIHRISSGNPEEKLLLVPYRRNSRLVLLDRTGAVVLREGQMFLEGFLERDTQFLEHASKRAAVQAQSAVKDFEGGKEEGVTCVHIEAFFEPHAVYTKKQRDIVKDRMRKKLHGFFTRTRRNYFYGELANRDPRKQEVFDKAFNSYGSFKKAWAHLYMYLSTGSEPSEVELDENMRNIEVATTPGLYYATAVHEVLDELSNEGYSIQFVLERGDYEYQEGYDSTEEYRYRSEDETKRDTVLQVEKDKAREVAIARQIGELAGEHVGNIERNIFVLLGPNDLELIDLFPEQLQTATSGERVLELRRGGKLDEFDRKYVAIYRKLKKGTEAPTSKEWQDLAISIGN